jgi:hypothetical protein
MGFTEYYSPDYVTARDRFLAAAKDLRATVQSHAFHAKGPNNESLTMDVAILGDPEAEHVVIISSGLHGVEGFFGSAIQLAWLLTRGDACSQPPRTRLVMAHALNPFGFAWRRRSNENNVDLNRNFLDDRNFVQTDPSYKESRAAYERLASFLNPASRPSRWEPYRIKTALWILSVGYDARRRAREQGKLAPRRSALKAILDLGLLELHKSLPVGQYEHPTGLFYGGAQPEETVRVVRDCLPSWVGGAAEVAHVDLHSGLGKHAEYRLLLADEKGSEIERWASEWFGDGVVEAWDARTDYNARGLMAKDLRDRFPHTRYHYLTAEFGTYPGVRVLGALRAENRAHFFDRPGTNTHRWAKRQVMEAFCPSASRWRNEVVKNGLTIIDQAVISCGGRQSIESGEGL